MDADPSSLPDDVEALKTALIAAWAEAAAEKARAVAASTELEQGRALIAHLNLEIEKLLRAIYGPRSERTARLLDQLELQLEEDNPKLDAVAAKRSDHAAMAMDPREEPRRLIPD